ncbi:MAG: hypothetical protein GWP09_01860 [Nitrospiraceae bacterium]|nr:hypothetical protein [Nitrospiraceae bacterium]
MVGCNVGIYSGKQILTTSERLLFGAVGNLNYLSNVKEIVEIRDKMKSALYDKYFNGKISLYERKELGNFTHLPVSGVSISNDAMRRMISKGYDVIDDIVRILEDKELVLFDSLIVPRIFGDFAISTIYEFEDMKEKYGLNLEMIL